jgi:NTP pyrophosphatase (non-canonical NTP hydrolase)
MELNDYQQQATTFAKYPKDIGITYCTLGLCGEAGEVAEKLKKVIRDGNSNLTYEKSQDILKELGDVLWYISQLSRELGFTMEEVAKGNITKLTSRMERNVLGGSGDSR